MYKVEYFRHIGEGWLLVMVCDCQQSAREYAETFRRFLRFPVRFTAG